jgi:L-seryl-tRNA(Ser) seleniumtransferase
VYPIPSIEQLRQRDALRALEARYGHATVVEALRAEAASLRSRLRAGDTVGDATAAIEAGVAERLAAEQAPSLRRVINATGVIIHTNLGRAPLAAAAGERVAALARGYTNLEYDVAAGARGRRDVHASRLLCRLTGAAAAVVVNNNAAATLLTLTALAAGREAIISRGELVEIGGGFRVPDVMAQSGALLREVGTTNRTRAADYAAAISEKTAIILRVHPSNFRIEGFTERPSLEELVAIGRTFNVPVVEDIGSGWLGGAGVREFGSSGVREFGGASDRSSWGAARRNPGVESAAPAAASEREGARTPRAGVGPREHVKDEPIVSESITAGAEVVMFSGDKLLGGPQAGIIAGTEAAIARIKSHPLMRALRVDKLTYAALEATLEEYAAGRAGATVPVVRMIAMAAAEIEARAAALARQLTAQGLQADVVAGVSTIGGGSAPGSQLPTRLVRLAHRELNAVQLEQRLRALTPPVIARIENDAVVLDLRTVAPDEDEALASALMRL